LNTIKVGILAPIAVVMLPEALIVKRLSSIWTESGDPGYRLLYRFAS